MQVVFVFGKFDKAIIGRKAVLVRLITAFICEGDVMGIVVLVRLCPILDYHHTLVQIGFLCKRVTCSNKEKYGTDNN